MSATILNIDLNKIKPDPNQPRRIFDEKKLQELAASIKEHGVIQPIGVYSHGNGGYIIAHGERRWRASQLVNMGTIPAIISQEPDVLRKRARQFVENSQRQNLTIIEEALFYRSMIEEEGLSKNELSRYLGRGGHTTFITNALLWLDTEEEIQTAVATKRLPKDPRVARALLDIPNKEARVKTAVALANRKAGIAACISAASNVAEKLNAPQKERKIKTPAITLAIKSHAPSPSSTLQWGQIRESAQQMCDACSLSNLVKHKEPAWALVVEAVEKTCDDCTQRNGRDLAICRECPGVEIVKRLAGVANG